mmetsp:Transcript_25443/g.100485  ORF Transcript_25443/g.100485 Transcript_25443/m.100485 type:complete len:112 (+) Transcript_25443:209-544(+)
MAGRQLRPQPAKMKHRFQRWERDVSAERESVLRFGDYGLKVVGNHPRRKDLGFYTLEQKCLQASQATLIKLLRSSTDSDGTKRVKVASGGARMRSTLWSGSALTLDYPLPE